MPRRPRGGKQIYSSTLPSTSGLDGVGDQCHVPSASSRGKTRYPLYRRLGGSHSRCGQLRKTSHPPGFDYVIPAPTEMKWVPGDLGKGVKVSVFLADNLTTFMCRLSWNLGALTSWNRQGLTRSVQGLIYLSLSGTQFVRRTDDRLENRENLSDYCRGKKYFSYPKCVPATGITRRPIPSIKGAISRVKRPGRATDHTSVSSWI